MATMASLVYLLGKWLFHTTVTINEDEVVQ